MRRPLVLSLLLHLVVFGAAYVGLPASRLDVAPPESPMTVDLVAVAERTNVPPARPVATPPARPMPEPAAERAPPPAPPSRPEPPAPRPQPPPEVAKAVAPKPKPAPAAKSEPPPQAAKAEPRVEPKPAPKPPSKPEPPTESAFESVLKTVEQLKREQTKAPTKVPDKATEQAVDERKPTSLDTQVAKALGRSTQTYDETMPMTISEIEAVRRQIERCWNLPAGARDAADLIVAIQVDMNLDGTPRSAVVTDPARMRTDPFYRAAAESALRAILNPQCHPFTLPREKYMQWKTMTLVFNPREMFGS